MVSLARTPNSILAALGDCRALQDVELVLGDILYEQRGPMDYVYFPNGSLVSMLSMVGPDKGAEIGLVARDGMVGMEAAVGLHISGFRALVQGEGAAQRLKASRLRSEMRGNAALQTALLKLSYSMALQAGQTAACNRFHTVDQRLARWLLMIRDSLGAARFKLTHEFVSHMLGVRRVGVTLAAGKLQRQGLIRYVRGDLEILDHAGLEQGACECYRAALAPSHASAGTPGRTKKAAKRS